MKPNRRIRKSEERGFALLLVFLLAAAIAISLYMELPRVAFESERNREQILIERGEEYARAVELFYRKNRRYPAKIEDLESFNDRRYLRKRYKDPLTGKDEWRLVHMGAGGLSDSLVEKPMQAATPTGTGTAATAGAGGQAGQLLGPDGKPIPPEVNAVVARSRPSDKMPVRGVGTPGQFGPGTPGFDPNNPNAQFLQQLQAEQQLQQQQQQQQQDPNNPNPNQIPNQQQPGQSNVPPGMINNVPGQPGYNPSLPQGLIPITSFPNQPGINPGGVQPGGLPVAAPGSPGFQPLQPPLQGGPNAAINAINASLRNPQPNQGVGVPTSGFGQSISNGFDQPTTTTANQGANPFSPGIAGVASLKDGVGIKVYNEKAKFKEWEFVFDYRKPKKKAPGSGVGMPVGAPTNSPTPTGTSGTANH